jgi:hypothetical protein
MFTPSPMQFVGEDKEGRERVRAYRDSTRRAK